MNTMKKFHWFWAWDDEKEEKWLRQFSHNGWHFQSVSFPGFYTFAQSDPIDYVYRLDYFTNRKDMSNYLQLFADANWDYMGEMNGWQYFRQEAVKGKASEIYTDNESKAKKYQQIMLLLIIIFPVFLNSIFLISQRTANDIISIIGIIMGAIMLFYVYAMIKLLRRITRLRKKL